MQTEIIEILFEFLDFYYALPWTCCVYINRLLMAVLSSQLVLTGLKWLDLNKKL